MSEKAKINLEHRLEQVRRQVEAQEAQDRLRLAQDVTPGTLPAGASDNASLKQSVETQAVQPADVNPSQVTRYPSRGIEYLPDVEKEPLQPPSAPEGSHSGGPEKGG